MTLRPGGGPARLLLELWARQALGFRESLTAPSPARSRLQELGYVNHLAAQAWDTGRVEYGLLSLEIR